MPTNTQLWRFETGDWVRSSPAVSNGVVYVGSYDNHLLYAIDAVTGKEKWRFETGARVWSSPAVSNGVVYIGSNDNNLYAINAVTGKEKWRLKTENGVFSSPAVSNGVVYFGSDDNNLYAVGGASAQPAYVQPVSQSNSGSSDPSGLLIFLIIGVVVVVGGYIGYSKIIRSKKEKPPSHPAFTSHGADQMKTTGTGISPSSSVDDEAIKILKLRYAKGEISAEKYDEMMEQLIK